MSEPHGETAEKLVEVHKAHEEWEGELLVSVLRDNGIEAAFQGDPNITFDMQELLRNSNEMFGIYVLENSAARAKELIQEFLSAATDSSIMESTAAQKLKVDKETIHRLRGALQEERRTFEFLAWIVVVFLGAAAALWMIWPSWLKMDEPTPWFRWVMVLLLTIGAVFASRSTGK